MKAQHLLVAAPVLSGLFLAVNSALAQTWTKTSAPITNWSSAACSANGSKLVAVVNGGPTYTSRNSGDSWTPTSAPITNWSAVAASADGRKLVAVVGAVGAFPFVPAPSPIFVSSDSGATWAQTSAPIANRTSVASSAN